MILQETRVTIMLHYIMIGIHLTTEKGISHVSIGDKPRWWKLENSV
jgi:hypothetical protein